jgi:hypothetical protein
MKKEPAKQKIKKLRLDFETLRMMELNAVLGRLLVDTGAAVCPSIVTADC